MSLHKDLLNAPAARTSTHPYLYFDRDDLPALRRKLAAPACAARWKRLLANARWFVRQKPFKAVRWSLGACATTAFAYALTGEKTFGARAKKEALYLLARDAWHSERGWNHGAELPTSEAAKACALVYDWCHDLFGAAERERCRERLLALSTRVYLRSVEVYKDWWVDNPVSNWCGVCHGGNGLAALALYHEAPEARRAAAYAWRGVRRFLERAVLEDGGGHEGVMYHNYGVRFGHVFASAAARLFGSGGELLTQSVRKRAGYWQVYLKGPDERYANFNNMNRETNAGAGLKHDERGPAGTTLALYERAVPGGDRLLRWGADAGGAPFYHKGADPFWFLWRSERPAVKKKPALAPAVLFRGAGHAVLQSRDLWLAYNGGWISNSSHNNRDLGSFVLVHGKARLLHDPGYGAGETGMHSTVLIAKRDQVLGSRARCLRFGSGKNFHYLASDLTAAYAGVGRRAIRHLVMVRGRYVVLLDDLAIQGPGRCDLEIRFQAPGPIRIEKGGARARISAAGRHLQIVPAAPFDAVCTEGGFEFKGQAFRYVRVAGDVRRRADTFVTVLYPSAKAGEVPSAEFKVQGARGVLTVKPPKGRADTLVFERARGKWMLASVNGASAKKIPDGSQQTVFRL
ncbi:MAG: heparinase II/III-family protein [Planctomycetota bacterium]|nr:heparinase II/III-family protein [Planctomycetota bacterium]